MKNLSERLSSLHLTSALLVGVILWLAWGMALDGMASYTEGFKTMNRILIGMGWYRIFRRRNCSSSGSWDFV